MSSATLHVIAACLLDAENRLLLVRKRNTPWLMMPGGKPEQGETARGALARELEEELGWQGDPEQLAFLGHFSAPAANETDTIVTAEVFWGRLDQDVRPQAEIAQLVRVALEDMHEYDEVLAPLQQHVLPALFHACRP